tara:strand:- start:35 stop:202 length:168 start_codon:yes stop_codon:yes gene_type:complete
MYTKNFMNTFLLPIKSAIPLSKGDKKAINKKEKPDTELMSVSLLISILNISTELD